MALVKRTVTTTIVYDNDTTSVDINNAIDVIAGKLGGAVTKTVIGDETPLEGAPRGRKPNTKAAVKK